MLTATMATTDGPSKLRTLSLHRSPQMLFLAKEPMATSKRALVQSLHQRPPKTLRLMRRPQWKERRETTARRAAAAAM